MKKLQQTGLFVSSCATSLSQPLYSYQTHQCSPLNLISGLNILISVSERDRRDAFIRARDGTQGTLTLQDGNLQMKN